MSVEVVYRVKKANGDLAGEYMDKKLADAHDQRLDCMYLIAELIQEEAEDIEENRVEAIAEHLINNKQALLGALKKVKDIPSEEKSAHANAEQSPNVEQFDSDRKVASA